MSYLKDQITAFKSEVTSSSSRLSNRRAATAAPKVTPSRASPAPSSQPPASNRPETKRKRADPNNVVYSQPLDTGTGKNIMTQVTYAIEHLKTKGTPLTLTDIVSYLSLHNRENEYKRTIGTILRNHEKVDYEVKGDGGEGTYSFRPVHNIRSGERLLGYLQSQPTAQGLNVRELRDGWPGAEEAINTLESEGKLLVTRNKKDNHARMVWPNDPSLAVHVDDEFQVMWQKIKLPEAAALADELEKAGLTPANKSRVTRAAPKPPNNRNRRGQRRGGRTTNVHMTNILKDYSHLKNNR